MNELIITREGYDNAVSPREAAEKLGVSKFRVYQWIHQGRMRILHGIRPYLIAEEDIIYPEPSTKRRGKARAGK